MSILLLLSLFVIWLAWSPGVVASVDPALGVSLLLGGFALLVLATRILNRRAMRSSGFERIDDAVRGFNRRMSAARLAIPVWFATGVFVFGWGCTVHRLLGPAGRNWLELPGVLVGLLPPLLAWVGLWWSQFDIDRALREQNLLVRLDRDMPVFAPPRFGPYFVNKLRTQILFTLVPLLLIMLLHDGAAIGLRQLAHTSFGDRVGLRWPLTDSAESAISLLGAGTVFLFSPLLLRRVLNTQRLADSPLRQRLEQLCGRTGLKCTNILLWRTQNNMGNAAVMGLVAPMRYVMLSDLLLSTLSDVQIEAVFAHELGHVKHRHLWWFLAFFTSLSTILFALGDVADRLLGPHLPQGQWVDLSSGLLTGAVVLIGFGMLSRRFERQADVFAARLIEQSKALPVVEVPQDLPGNLNDIAPSTPGAFDVPNYESVTVAPIGSFVFASALEQIAIVNNISIVAPNWTHGSIATRMRFIRQFGRNAATAEKFDRQTRRLRNGLIAGVIIGVAATAWTLLR